MSIHIVNMQTWRGGGYIRSFSEWFWKFKINSISQKIVFIQFINDKQTKIPKILNQEHIY